jgi:hypothetical protein
VRCGERGTDEIQLDGPVLAGYQPRCDQCGDTFRRRMEPQLRPLTEPNSQPVLRSDGGRPAQVFVRAEEPELNAAARRRLLLPRASR